MTNVGRNDARGRYAILGLVFDRDFCPVVICLLPVCVVVFYQCCVVYLFLSVLCCLLVFIMLCRLVVV